MEISLMPNIERLLRIKIAEGLYDSLNEAINATLNIALTGNFVPEERIAALNADLQDGINDADAGRVADAFEFLDELSVKYGK